MRSLIPFLAAPLVSSELHIDDLKRAKTMRPRSGYLGAGSVASANVQLNKHLYSMDGVALKPCEEFAVDELRNLLEVLLPMTSDELKEIYPQVDGRRAVYETLEEMQQHWREVPKDDVRVRDGHCHEAVMWFVHHLAKDAQHAAKPHVVIPKLPIADHTVETRDDHDAAGKFYDSKVTCQNCHKGGLGNPFPIDLGKPEPGSLDLKRRCYTNYKDLYNLTCGPCDGIAGPYWGDDTDKYFDPPTCVEVGLPGELDDVVPFAMPEMFATTIVGGSDRWGRTTNPQMPDLAPFTVRQNHMYGQISGKWYMRAPRDEDLWISRHDTFYANVAWNGTWDVNQSMYYNLTQIHAQSRQQQLANDTGDMVSLNRSNTWPTNSPDPPGVADPFCVCIPDPVGVPDVSMTRKDGLAHLEYLGRMKLAPIEYLGRTVVMDHYANWFFHVFMEVNESAPNYGRSPIRLASAYAGTAVYKDWIFDDPEVAHPGIFSADIPHTKSGNDKFGRYCLNPTGRDTCFNVKTIEDEDGPPTWPPKSTGHGPMCVDHPGCAHLKPDDGICCADGARMECCEHTEPCTEDSTEEYCQNPFTNFV
jgi:hypothetical protein